MNDLGRAVRSGLHTAALIALAGAAVVASGSPFLFPSLGPSAYVLAVMPDAPASDPDRVFGGHVIGVAAGLLSYHLIAVGLVATAPPTPMSIGGFRLAASAAASVGLTTAGMRATQFQHPPACATTLIVSLGLLADLEDAAVILVSVVMLLLAEELVRSIRAAGGVRR